MAGRLPIHYSLDEIQRTSLKTKQERSTIKNCR